MNIQSSGKAVPAFGYALAVMNLLNAVLVAAKEKNEALLGVMQTVTGHHWITIVFALAALGTILALVTKRDAEDAALAPVTAAVIGSTIFSGLAIAAFFLFRG
jgi:hypothetical protein